MGSSRSSVPPIFSFLRINGLLSVQAISIQVARSTGPILLQGRGGTYFYSQTIRIDVSGFPTNRSKIWAYPGEHPLLDFTNQPYADANRAFLLTTNANYWHIKGLEIARAGDNGM